jgi:hypothetical protein
MLNSIIKNLNRIKSLILILISCNIASAQDIYKCRIYDYIISNMQKGRDVGEYFFNYNPDLNYTNFLYNLKGNISEIEWETNGDFSHHEIVRFNKNKQIIYIATLTPFVKIETFYNDYSLNKIDSTIRHRNNFRERKIYKHEDDDKILSNNSRVISESFKHTYKNDTIIYFSYIDTNRIIKRYYWKNKLTRLSVFEDTNLIREELYHIDGFIIESKNWNENKKYYSTTKYDNQGRIIYDIIKIDSIYKIKKIEYNDLFYSKIIRYDSVLTKTYNVAIEKVVFKNCLIVLDENNPNVKITFNNSKDIIETIKYGAKELVEYKYDKYDNWINQTIYYNGSRFLTTKRKIEYYKN